MYCVLRLENRDSTLPKSPPRPSQCGWWIILNSVTFSKFQRELSFRIQTARSVSSLSLFINWDSIPREPERNEFSTAAPHELRFVYDIFISCLCPPAVSQAAAIDSASCEAISSSSFLCCPCWETEGRLCRLIIWVAFYTSVCDKYIPGASVRVWYQIWQKYKVVTDIISRNDLFTQDQKLKLIISHERTRRRMLLFYFTVDGETSTALTLVTTHVLLWCALWKSCWHMCNNMMQLFLSCFMCADKTYWDYNSAAAVDLCLFTAVALDLMASAKNFNLVRKNLYLPEMMRCLGSTRCWVFWLRPDRLEVNTIQLRTDPLTPSPTLNIRAFRSGAFLVVFPQ